MHFRTHALILVNILLVIFSANGFNEEKFKTEFGNTSSVYVTNNEDIYEEARKKHKDDYTLSILMGALMVKSIIFPLAVKAMAVMSSVAVLLSTMSLIVSSIVGYTKLAWSSTHPILKVFHVDNVAWAKNDRPIKFDEVYENNPDFIDYSGGGIPQPEHHIHYYQK
ncbi:uncharacterized protein [Leptinotarsa decemlineata]|uniref:uncharacterized protein n=1 Tax=Leptinotarsa decemlineata TaxID=7539 RepID=UPI003D30A2AC